MKEEGLCRLEAINEAIAFYRQKHTGGNAFTISGNVAFCYDPAKGVHLKTSNDIPAGEILMAMPKEERVSYYTIK